MFSFLRKPPGIFALALLLLLLGAAAAHATPTLLLPAPTTAETPHNEPAGIPAPPDNTFTYQGTLKQAGNLVNGICDFQFSLWDAAQTGNQVGANDEQPLPVSEGIFTATLNENGDLGDTPFNGGARWLQIAVRCPSGSGSYETLAPRQPLTPAPYAHSLRPGAVVQGTVPAGGATLSLASNGDGLMVSAGLNGVSVGHTGDDGIHICATGSESICELNNQSNGLEIGSAEHYGVVVGSAGVGGVAVTAAGENGVGIGTAGENGVGIGTAGENGVAIGSANENGMIVNEAGGDGVHICTTGSETTCNSHTTNNGLEVGSAENYGVLVDSAVTGIFLGGLSDDGIYVAGAADDGMRVFDTGGAGISVNHAGEDGLFVCRTGNQTTCTARPSNNGLEIGSTEENGVYIDSAGFIGVYVLSAGNDGVHVGGAADDGVYANTTNNVTHEWGFTTPDKIAGSNITLRTITLVAQAGGDTALQPGDVVGAVGVAGPLPDSRERLAVVVPSGAAGSSIAGVVESRVVLERKEWPEGTAEDAPEQWTLRSASGAAQPGDYVALTIAGVAQVRVSPQTAVSEGQRLTVASGGAVRPLQSRTIDGMVVTEGAPTVGTALSTADSEGLVWVLVNPQ